MKAPLAAARRDDGHSSREAPRYRAFLLRCWEVQSSRPGQPGTWRFQLQDAETGEKRSFADLARLVGFLREEFGANAGQADRGGDGGRR